MTSTSTHAARVRDAVDHPIIDADGHFVEIGPLLHDEILASLEDIGWRRAPRSLPRGCRVAARHVLEPGEPLRPRGARPMAGDAVVVGMADRQRARPRHVASSRAALRAARRDGHRLHDPVPVDGTRVLRGDRRGTVVGVVPRGEPLPRAAVRAVRGPVHGGGDGADEHARAGDRRSRVRGSRARREVGADRRVRQAPGRAAMRTASTCSGSTASTTTTRSGRRAWSSASHRWCTARCSRDRVTRSISNYVYNHVNGLAAAHESLCKSLFLAGVTRRFPSLRFGFLEGGVAWACALFAGLVGHWEKRNRDAIGDARPRPSRRRRAARLLRAVRRRRSPGTTRRHPRLLRSSGGAAGPGRRVRGVRDRRSRRPPRAVRAQLLLRVRSRRPARRVGVP